MATKYAQQKALKEGRRALILELAHNFPHANAYEIGSAIALQNPAKAANELKRSPFWPRSLGSDEEFNPKLVAEMRSFLGQEAA